MLVQTLITLGGVMSAIWVSRLDHRKRSACQTPMWRCPFTYINMVMGLVIGALVAHIATKA